MVADKPKIRTIKQAISRARVLWGKTAMVQYNPRALGPDDRAKAIARQRELYEKKKAKTATPDELKEWMGNRGVGLTFPYSVGAVMFGMFFEVKGHGDTWEEAFAKAEARI